MPQPHRSLLTLLIATCLIPVLHAETPDDLIKRAKLVFSDEFNRPEKIPGNGWDANSDHGNRVEVQDNALFIMKGKGANHSVSARHDNPFDDGIIRLRFQLFDRTGLKININDKKAREITWAGHIARVVVQPRSVTIQDDKTGYYELGIRKKRKDESLSKEEKANLAKLLKTKKRVIKTPIELKTWHQITIVNLGPKFEVYLNQKSLGSFTSEGLDHKVKQIMALGVSGKVIIDDVQIWSLD